MVLKKWTAIIVVASLSSVTAIETAQAQSRALLGGVAGGLIGGVIAGAIIANERQQAAQAYRYGRAERRSRSRVARAPRRQNGPAQSQNAVVNTSADPFAKSSPATTTVKATE